MFHWCWPAWESGTREREIKGADLNTDSIWAENCNILFNNKTWKCALCFSFPSHDHGSSTAPFLPLCWRSRRASLRDVQHTWDGETGAGLPGSGKPLEAVCGRQEESKFKKCRRKSSTQLLAQLAVLPSFCLQALGLIRETRVHLSFRNAKALLASSTFFETHLKWQMANRYRYGFLIFFPSKHWSIDVAALCYQRCDSLWLLQKLNHSEVISILLI